MAHATIFVIAGLGLFWVAMLGLLWRRSLIGMLVGVVFGWVSVVLGAIGAALLRSGEGDSVGAAGLVFAAALVCGLQAALGISIVVARIARRGSLDVQEAGLLEG
jgi:NADH:ubiquinone oxidoreductase subunit K